MEERRINPMLSPDIFGDTPPNKIRFKKPVQPKFQKKGAKIPTKKAPEKFEISVPKKLKKVTTSNEASTNLFDNNLVVGNIVKHLRFGKGEVLKIEGKGADTKAEIKFEAGGVKKLLLRFAKLQVIG
jgi:DNA helicase-2/ATP-dependent DNA helicase PcrA